MLHTLKLVSSAVVLSFAVFPVQAFALEAPRSSTAALAAKPTAGKHRPLSDAVRDAHQRRAAQDAPGPSVAVDPASFDFAEQVVNSSSKPQRITITNTGTKPLYVNSVAVSGDNAADFALGEDTCTGATVTPGKSCVLGVTFTPTATDARRAAVTLTDNALDSPQQVNLTGTGIISASVDPTPDR